ncbi:MAG: D-alanine--D-alanine ligase family protein [Bacteroidota bacterium]|nr:D-alanine--D-alanine ligase [Bacteroidota bacterium]MDW8137413.1 D-alanine--D-alanine ligase family protein [Bacteroidota bacterium]
MRIGVLFGGVSVEHEVSILTGLQALYGLQQTVHAAYPVYIDKQGHWYTGPALAELESFQQIEAIPRRATRVAPVRTSEGRVVLEELPAPRWRRPRRWPLDMALLALHGGEGENGGLQGLLETLDVPYTGSGVLGSALGMDKVLTKFVCLANGLPVLPFVWFRERDWEQNPVRWTAEAERLGYPLVVKPARLGSSIGVRRVTDRPSLEEAVEQAFGFDDKVLIETALLERQEINCAVLGTPEEALPSVCEEPVGADEVLSYADKYLRGDARKGMAGAQRRIPAPISEALARRIQELAVQVFRLFELSGTARVDFLIDRATETVYVNEVNTIPGSLAFYLWERSGVPLPELLERLIRIGLERYRVKHTRTRSYATNLLAKRSQEGLKLLKGP